MGSPRDAVAGGTGLTVVGPVRTLDAVAPRAQGIIVRSGRVAALLAPREEIPPGPVLRLPPGAVAVPGFVDPHLHLLGMAARRLGMDVGDEELSTPELLARVGEAVAGAGGGWVRVYGVDEALAPDRRRPTRAEIDTVSPATPVVVRHRAGYEVLLNSRAFAALGASAGSGDGWLEAGDPLVAAVPDHDRDELRESLAGVLVDLSRAGLTTIVDATFENDLGTALLLGEVAGRGPRVALMPGVPALPQFAAAGLRYGDVVSGVPIRHAKILPPGAGGVDVASAVDEARSLGWPVAVHAIDVSEVAAAVEAFGEGRGGKDRIEHCGLSLPDQIEDIARTGAAVVTQPAFLTRRGVKYREELSGVEQEWIYRIGSLRRAGVLVAASSDAPVAPPDPLEEMSAARTRGGDELTAGERVSAEEALAMVTRDAAVAADLPGGVLAAGRPGDVVVLSADPVISGTRPEVLATIVGGVVVSAREEILGRPGPH